MTSNIRSRSRQRLSAFFSRSASKTREGETTPTESTHRGFEATGRNRLLKERNGAASPLVAYPPSSFRGPAENGFARRSSYSSTTSATSRPGSFDGEAGYDTAKSPAPLSRTNSRPASIASRKSSRSSIFSFGSQKAPSVSSAAVGKEEKKSKRKSWLPRSSKNKGDTQEEPASTAWIAGDTAKIQYGLVQLTSGERVSELWDEGGDTLIYLFPRESNKGPSFRVRSSLYTSSKTLVNFANLNAPGIRRGVANDKRKSQTLDLSAQMLHQGDLATPPLTPKVTTPDNSSIGSYRETRTSENSADQPRQFSLYLPLELSAETNALTSYRAGRITNQDDIEKLVAVRNLFAFLVGQSLVATPRRPALFHIFMNISNSLRAYDFTNVDGSSFGEVADNSFNCYVEELELGDVRMSRERTVEALVLGERMKSATLFNEAFVHAVGKYEDIQVYAKEGGSSSKYNLVSQVTRNRLERASIDLHHRQKTINNRLQEFEFPSIYAGILDSRTAEERKQISFAAWKENFSNTRKHVLSYYKQKYGSWPPKGNSKKGSVTTGVLNRMVLRDLYHDFSDMYDLYVDRNSRTTRHSDGSKDEQTTDDQSEQIVRRVLRRVFDEYDRSSPPVQPPVPFDTPLLPKLPVGASETKSRARKFKDDEVVGLLTSATNKDCLLLAEPENSQFLASMRWFERREARGKTLIDIVNIRAGMWMFMYVVLQALPMLVVDAPGVQHHQGVEYFLCEPLRSGLPWVTSTGDGGIGRGRNGRAWYGVSGGSGVVHLPTDVVEHGVEGVYRRSHCWLRAVEWSEVLERQERTRFQQMQDQPQALPGRAESTADDYDQTPKALPTGNSKWTSYIPHEPPRLPPIITDSMTGAPAMLMQTPLGVSGTSSYLHDPFSAQPPSMPTTGSSTPVSASDWPSPPLGSTAGFPVKSGRGESPPARGRGPAPVSYNPYSAASSTESSRAQAVPAQKQSGHVLPHKTPANHTARQSTEGMSRRQSAHLDQTFIYTSEAAQPQQQRPGQQEPVQLPPQSQRPLQHFSPEQLPLEHARSQTLPLPQAAPNAQEASQRQSRPTQGQQRPSSVGPSAYTSSPASSATIRQRNSSSGPLSPPRQPVASPSSWRGTNPPTDAYFSLNTTSSPAPISGTATPGNIPISPLVAPPTFHVPGATPRAASRSRDSLIGFGLEALPLPAGVHPMGAGSAERPSSSASGAVTSGKATFDEIFKDMEQERGRTSWRDRLGGSRAGSKAR